MSFGAYIKRARADNNLTQREAAKQIGIDFTYLSKLETNTMPPPSRETLRKMAFVYALPLFKTMIKGGRLPGGVKEYLLAHPEEVKTLLHKARGGQTKMSIDEAVRSARGGDAVEEWQGYA